MTTPTVLHYLTQWMWLSGSFTHGPIATSRLRTVPVSRMNVINDHVYPPPAELICLGDEAPAEGADTAAMVVDRLGGLRPDVVHLHHGYCLPDASALARALEVPLVVSFWGYDVTALPQKEPDRVLPYCGALDAAIVPSRYLAGVVESLGVGPDRVRIIPGPVEDRFFAPSPLPAQPRAAFVGRFVAKKGIDVLLTAWPTVRRAIPDAELILLGFGDDVPSSDSEAGVRVFTPDPVDPRGQVHDLLRWCRVYVSPSTTGPDGDSESQHIGNLEAQAAGRVVVTTDHAAIPEFVDHQVNGMVVAQDDPAALADALVTTLSDMSLCRALAAAATQAARRFRVAAISAAHTELYEELTARSS